MSTTPNLLLSHIASGQNQKEVTANDAFDGLDEALCGNTSITVLDANYTFATVAGAIFFGNIFFTFTGFLTALRNVILPSGRARLFVVKNDCLGGSPIVTESLLFKVGTGAATVTIADANAHMLYSDGVNSVYQVS